MTATGADRLTLARALAGGDTLDVSAALALLNTMPDPLNPSLREAVEHAKRAVSAAPGGDHRHQAVARYMIARVAVLLEKAAREEAARGARPQPEPSL